MDAYDEKLAIIRKFFTILENRNFFQSVYGAEEECAEMEAEGRNEKAAEHVWKWYRLSPGPLTIFARKCLSPSYSVLGDRKMGRCRVGRVERAFECLHAHLSELDWMSGEHSGYCHFLPM